MGKGIDNLRYREMEVKDGSFPETVSLVLISFQVGKCPDCCRAFSLFNI